MNARTVTVAAAASAAMLWAASPAVGASWIAWVALVPVAGLIAARPDTGEARLAVPLCYGLYLELLVVPSLPFGLAEGQFGDPALPVLVGDSPVLVVALLAIPLFAGLLWLVGFGRPAGPFQRGSRPAAWALIGVPAASWALLDFARAGLDPGGLWGPLYLSQATAESGALASLAGPWVLTFAIVAVNYALAVAWVRRRPLFALAPAAAVAVAVLLAPAPTEPKGELVVAALQPGYDTADRDRPALRRFRSGTWDLAALDLIDELGGMSREAAAAGAELVVWPEAAMYADPQREPAVAAALRRVAEETGAILVVPFFRPRPERQSGVLAVVPGAGPSGTAALTAAVPKQRPMWFLGEGALEGRPAPIDAEVLRLGALLGVDAQDPRSASRLADGGAELLAAASHDWQQLAAHHRAAALIAARGAGLPLVRADWRYGSIIASADGRVLADAGTEQRRAVLVSPLPVARNTGVAPPRPSQARGRSASSTPRSRSRG